MEAGHPQELQLESQRARIDALLSTPLPGSFAVRVADARAQNTFICNETHWRALKAVKLAEDSAASAGTSTTEPAARRLRAAYFLHVPYAADDDPSHDALAAAVATLLVRMVELEMPRTAG